MKTKIEELAILGGAKLFASPRSIGQLETPECSDYLALLKESYEIGILTSNGPVVKTLEKKFACFHEVDHCIALANAGVGIIMLIQLFAQGRKGEVIMPSFSYRGLPHFAQLAGQSPRFCEVERTSHVLDPKAVEAAIGQQTTSILSVCNFNNPGDIDGLCQVASSYNIPIFFDSVYAVGSTYRGKILGSFANAEVYSLHATKLLNGFEGGYITTNDNDLADTLRCMRDFKSLAFYQENENILGLNARMNEMHAAMALLSLDRFHETISLNHKRYKTYQENLALIPGLSLIPYLKNERANYQMAVAEIGPSWPLTRDQTLNLLRSEGIAISPYYSPPLHMSEHCPDGIEVPKLPVTDELAKKYIQLPVGALMSINDVLNVCNFLTFLYEHGQEISEKLDKWVSQ